MKLPDGSKVNTVGNFLEEIKGLDSKEFRELKVSYLDLYNNVLKAYRPVNESNVKLLLKKLGETYPEHKDYILNGLGWDLQDWLEEHQHWSEKEVTKRRYDAVKAFLGHLDETVKRTSKALKKEAEQPKSFIALFESQALAENYIDILK